MSVDFEAMCRDLDAAQVKAGLRDAYYAGSQPLSFMAPEAREALKDRLRSMVVNVPRLVVDSLSERLQVSGFTLGGQPMPRVWEAWEGSGFEESHGLVHTEALILGSSFVLAWADSDGAATLSVESARECAVRRDPLTREPVVGIKRWIDSDARRARLLVFEPHQVRSFVSAAEIPAGGMAPNTGWNQTATMPNPLGVVPLVPFVNRARLLGEPFSEIDTVSDLADALNKIMTDLLVSSEFYARPRRWATGMQIEIDENGNAENPFTDSPSRVWTSEQAETKFGQFPQADLSSFETATEMVLRQVGMLSALPPHYLSSRSTQPTSADAIRSSEASLVSKAYQRQRAFTQSWARVAALVEAIETGGALPKRVQVQWASPETRTVGQQADAASKLVSSGIIPVEQAQADLGYSQEQRQEMRSMNVRAALDSQPLQIPRGDQ